MKQTQRLTPIASINNQWPVKIHVVTIATDKLKLTISANENRPQPVNFIFLFLIHNLKIYWQAGRSRNAKAIDAITKIKEGLIKLFKTKSKFNHLLAVQNANNIDNESKKKNIIKREIDAPKGKQSACIVSSVCTSIEDKI